MKKQKSLKKIAKPIKKNELFNIPEGNTSFLTKINLQNDSLLLSFYVCKVWHSKNLIVGDILKIFFDSRTWPTNTKITWRHGGDYNSANDITYALICLKKQIYIIYPENPKTPFNFYQLLM